MPTAHIVRRSQINRTFRVQQVAGMFDVPHATEITHEWDATLPLEERTWSVGLIVGPSGAGKSVLGRELFPDALFVDSAFPWPNDQSVLDGFGETHETREVVAALSSVGLSSPPHWLKPYAHLSNGQRFRCDLARALLSDRALVVFDEFTSVVDRDVAKVCSSAVAKAIRKRKSPRFVALSCHFDIIEWLQPDWVYDVAAARFEWRQLRRRPAIKLSIHRVDPASAWPLFRGHHYLSATLATQAKSYCAFWGEKPVAFAAVIHHVGTLGRNHNRAFRLHRAVVLPDFQGVGVGRAFVDAIAGLYRSQGFRFYCTSSHPAVIHPMSRSVRWRMVRHPKQVVTASSLRAGYKEKIPGSGAASFGGQSRGRLTASFEYIGENLLATAPSLT
jgi:GNAT superfamily N-acetyltransferase